MFYNKNQNIKWLKNNYYFQADLNHKQMQTIMILELRNKNTNKRRCLLIPYKI